MTKPLPLSDFRAVRHILDPDDFAFPGEELAPSDPIDPDTWHHIMDLPDDVAITTSDHRGRYLRLLVHLEGEWIKAVGTFDQDELSGYMLGALECFQCATFDFLHGYYRSALANLRSALEVTLLGVYGNFDATSKKYRDCKDGIARVSFNQLRREVLRLIEGCPNAQLLAVGQPLATVYEDLCRYTHCRPDATDGDLWQSNGPIYTAKGVRLTLQAGLHVYAICFLLVRIARPGFRISKKVRILFQINWIDHHAQLLQELRRLD